MKIMVLIGLLMISCSVSATERPTIDKFFAGQRIQNVSISPDGRYLALTITSDGYHYLGVIDRQQKSGVKPLMRLEKKEHTSFRWCKWAKADRVLCSILLSTNVLPSKTNLIGGASIYYGTTRIVAVDADGKSEKILVDSKYAYGGQFQDRIIDWLRDDPDDVLIELQGYVGAVGSGYGAIEVKRLNIRTGTTTLVESGKLHVAGFATDGRL